MRNFTAGKVSYLKNTLQIRFFDTHSATSIY